MKYAILINPVSSFSYYYERLSANFKVLAVFSPQLCLPLNIIEKFADVHLILSGNIKHDAHLIGTLTSGFGIAFSLNCNESDLLYGEKLINTLSSSFFSQNEEKYLSMRENKFSMQLALKEFGLHHIEQQVIYSNCNRDHLSKHCFPLVVKPISDSYCSSGVFICNSEAELLKAIDYNFSNNTILNKKCESILIEKFIRGDEYIVDGFVYDGRLSISGVFLYKKTIIHNHPVYNHINTINKSNSGWKILSEFAENAVKALHINTGLVHFELMMNEDGVWMVELNSRLSGCAGAINKLAQYVYGLDQLSLIENAIGFPLSCKPSFRFGRIYCVQNHKAEESDFVPIRDICSKVDVIFNKNNNSHELSSSLSRSLLDTSAYVILADDETDNLEKACAQLDKYFYSS